MNIFGKKKESDFDEIEEGDELELEREDRKLTRKFKDLSPENRKKRKEPPKPWGKKERIIVLAFFLMTTLAAAFMFLSSLKPGIFWVPKINFGQINFKNFFGEEVIEMGN
jgi:hypothetical protein